MLFKIFTRTHLRTPESAVTLVQSFVFTVPSHTFNNCFLSSQRFHSPGSSRLDCSLELSKWNLHVVLKMVWVFILTDVFVLLSPKTHRQGWGGAAASEWRVCVSPACCPIQGVFLHPSQWMLGWIPAPPTAPHSPCRGVLRKMKPVLPPWFQALLFRVSRQLHPSGWAAACFCKAGKCKICWIDYKECCKEPASSHSIWALGPGIL